MCSANCTFGLYDISFLINVVLLALLWKAQDQVCFLRVCGGHLTKTFRARST